MLWVMLRSYQTLEPLKLLGSGQTIQAKREASHEKDLPPSINASDIDGCFFQSTPRGAQGRPLSNSAQPVGNAAKTHRLNSTQRTSFPNPDHCCSLLTAHHLNHQCRSENKFMGFSLILKSRGRKKLTSQTMEKTQKPSPAGVISHQVLSWVQGKKIKAKDVVLNAVWCDN